MDIIILINIDNILIAELNENYLRTNLNEKIEYTINVNILSLIFNNKIIKYYYYDEKYYSIDYIKINFFNCTILYNGSICLFTNFNNGNNLYNVDMSNIIVEFEVKNNVMILKHNNNVKQYYEKINGIYQIIHINKNFDYIFYINYIKNFDLNTWEESLEHWILFGKNLNIIPYEKIFVNINDNIINCYINYSHLHLYDEFNNVYYKFEKEHNDLLINVNVFIIENNKITFVSNNHNYKKYHKINGVYEEFN